MISTTEAAMATLIATTLNALTPRVAYKATSEATNSAWNQYLRKGEFHRAEEVGAGPDPDGTRSRRYRLTWLPGNRIDDGIYTNTQVETETTLRVRTDYVMTAADSDTLEHASLSDYHHLLDVLQSLTRSNTGLMLVTGVTRALAGPIEAQDVIRYDHTYVIRYLCETVAAF